MNNEKGFTLVEIVVSIAIISISLVILIAALDRSMSSAAETTVITEASMLGAEKLQLALAGDVPDVGIGDWKTDARFPAYRFKQTADSTALPKVVRITLEVDRGEKKEFEIQAYMIKQ